jgi:hypothetical protein
MMSSQAQPLPRNVGGRPPGIARRRRDLVEAYVQALGGPARVTPVQRVEIERAASLVLLAADMRDRALRGEAVAITDLTRLEGTADRAIRRLNLPAPDAAPVQTLADYIARRHAGPDEAEG